jgi:hypothetical protein
MPRDPDDLTRTWNEYHDALERWRSGQLETAELSRRLQAAIEQGRKLVAETQRIADELRKLRPADKI